MKWRVVVPDLIPLEMAVESAQQRRAALHSAYLGLHTDATWHLYAFIFYILVHTLEEFVPTAHKKKDL